MIVKIAFTYLQLARGLLYMLLVFVPGAISAQQCRIVKNSNPDRWTLLDAGTIYYITLEDVSGSKSKYARWVACSIDSISDTKIYVTKVQDDTFGILANGQRVKAASVFYRGKQGKLIEPDSFLISKIVEVQGSSSSGAVGLIGGGCIAALTGAAIISPFFYVNYHSFGFNSPGYFRLLGITTFVTMPLIATLIIFSDRHYKFKSDHIKFKKLWHFES